MDDKSRAAIQDSAQACADMAKEEYGVANTQAAACMVALAAFIGQRAKEGEELDLHQSALAHLMALVVENPADNGITQEKIMAAADGIAMGAKGMGALLSAMRSSRPN